MKIIVLMKEVPDTYGERKLNLETGLAERGESETVLDEIGERALELAVAQAGQIDDVEITVVSMGPTTATATLRKALAMGADRLVHIADEKLAGADLGLTAEILSAAIRRAGFDLIIAGNVSTDGLGGVMPAMIAELLGVPHASTLSSVDISDGRVSGIRETDSGSMRVTAELPAVISITDRFPAARFPNFKGIMAAKKKPVETLTAADLGIDPEALDTPRSIMLAVSQRPPRAAGTKIVDEGDGGEKLAEFLVQNRLA
ncbi:electron transfer flavoprotein beta subunit [Arthrobacter subterraneus]|uniref:Electron transfer flavoprotein subunit beta n=1 Tax=Arthrobacter subterraneus TaxID=335973 RepID=A0A1G8IQ07_9MICC|nr:electron transfer flavoprotein subunit beta/FixA family protein [Arthrobacter subterraneus]SDI21005.1 electron transfer flavoprotein beta subunit [Arthrobacter subterraneus]